MLYLNQISQKQDEYALNFNGTNQYLKSQTTAQGGLDFIQWDRFQPWTFFIRVKTSKSVTLYDQRIGASGENRGIAISIIDKKLKVAFIFAGDKYLIVDTPVRDFSNYNVITVTYDGSSTASGFSIKINDVLQTLTTTSNDPPSSIINTNKSFLVGKNPYTTLYDLNGSITTLSFVDYVKSPTELTADFNNKKQSKGTGEWLLAPIEPIYKNNGVEQIKTLSTTNINQPLPNPNAFVNEQGYKINLINYPIILVKGVDLIKI